MIGFLCGKVIEQGEGRVLLMVGPSDGNSGVGYVIQLPQSSAYSGVGIGHVKEYYIHTHVREDALDLFGFLSSLEKELFLTLLSVTGIGPKGALGIIGKTEPSQLIRAILEKDRDFLTQIQGIGKKTAERVVLELADPLRKKVESGVFPAGHCIANAKIHLQNENPLRTEGRGFTGGVIQDAKSALMGLGYREQEISPLLDRVLAEFDPPPARVEDLIRFALRQLA